ncbi:hypothetical protein BTR23_08480 [Alkalihalophilus pseudofirmus]|uniref:hypothetical protein n=1 Tax=Alkalihalobacterium alkalinitrilicum TaxID=427920 RepID=UPI00094C5257|nr:hypothetical protein [Alkalihalobacterium alkalinitrilicum]OLO39091.1 hypothetical protein BTR23_08480 [Alkalihalophilus pseudofirmus]
MFQNVLNSLNVALDDWGMMQQTSGDEGAEHAERFERHFYNFIDEFEKWFRTLDPQPEELEDAENLVEVKQIEELLPGPLHLNFTMELERILDGYQTTRFD